MLFDYLADKHGVSIFFNIKKMVILGKRSLETKAVHKFVEFLG